MRYHQAVYPVATQCRVLGVSPSGFYARQKRTPPTRAQADAVVLAKMRALHARSDGVYGVPRIHADLHAAGIHVGPKWVTRLMRAAGLVGASRRRRVRTMRRDPSAAPASNLVQRAFTATAPNQLGVAEIAYIPTWAGFPYLAIVLEVLTRRIVGWAMRTDLRVQGVLDAMAIRQRRPQAVIRHSDEGCQYTSLGFGRRCRELGVRQSMGAVGDASANAIAESFFATLERELLDRRRFATQAEAQLAVFGYIEGWYNPYRRHSALGYESPVSFERVLSDTAEAA